MSTKSIVYTKLIEAGLDDAYISGENLAKICGVSRTAVWKAVNSLRKDGKQIEAITNKGYRIAFSDELSEDMIRYFLPDNLVSSLFVFKTIDSTNTQAKKICASVGNVRTVNGLLTDEGKRIHKAVVIAEEQTKGRGRQGRRFYSPKNRGIYLSIIYSPKTHIIQPAKLTVAAAVGVCRAVKQVFGFETQIKWVNDIFMNGKKICGILTEGISNFETGEVQTAIVGIGLNICKAEDMMPADMKDIAGSILNESSKTYSRSKIAAAIIKEVLSIYEHEEYENSDDIFEEYRKRSFIIGKKVQVKSLVESDADSYVAEVVDIDDCANLVVKTQSSEILHLQSGEISLNSKAFV